MNDWDEEREWAEKIAKICAVDQAWLVELAEKMLAEKMAEPAPTIEFRLEVIRRFK